MNSEWYYSFFRESSEEMKIACTHFQCAAWAFHELPDRHPNQVGMDMSAELLAFLSQVKKYFVLFAEMLNIMVVRVH